MDAGEPKPPEKILWMRLPDWADEVPENCVFYMMEELAVRHKIPLTPYDPNNKEKGRKIVLTKKSDLKREKHCDACGKENDHFSFQCPNNDPDRDLMEQKVINGVKMVKYCDLCQKEDDHSTWQCPDLEYIPYDPTNDLICEACGVEGEHWTDVCPNDIGPSPEREPGLRECLICKKYDDSEHWTEDCPVLAKGDRKFCFGCQELGDHETIDCCKFVETVVFCSCCEATGDHTTENCPREPIGENDRRKQGFKRLRRSQGVAERASPP